MPLIVDGTTGVTFNDASLQGAAASPFGLKNRIINGDMVISQRNGTSSVTPTNGQYTLDRYFSVLSQASKYTVQQNAGSVTPPAGFTNYLGVTSTSSYSVGTNDFFQIVQAIEGFNTADLAWGTANARTVTLSFWVRSSLTGTFAGAFNNASNNRSYVFNYTISSANTWEQKTITVAGDTTGTWGTTNGIGINLRFSLGGGSTYQTTAGAWTAGDFFTSSSATSVVGTNGATFYITGVQLERNTTATPFEWIPYGLELQLCQRYYQRMNSVSAFTVFGSGACNGATTANIYVKYPTTMRSQPTSSQSNLIINTTADRTITTTALYAGNDSCLLQYGISGATAGHAAVLIANNSTTAFLDFAAEL